MKSNLPELTKIRIRSAWLAGRDAAREYMKAEGKKNWDEQCTEVAVGAYKKIFPKKLWKSAALACGVSTRLQMDRALFWDNQ